VDCLDLDGTDLSPLWKLLDTPPGPQAYALGALGARISCPLGGLHEEDSTILPIRPCCLQL